MKEADGGHPIGLILTSRFSLPEDPVRNLDFEAHGRKMAAEAWVVTVAMLMTLAVAVAVTVAVAVEERDVEMWWFCFVRGLVLFHMYYFPFGVMLVVRMFYWRSTVDSRDF